jgi:hypothetical protein
MPVIQEDVPITRVLGVPRTGAARHVFVAANFFVLRMLNRYRDELSVSALPTEMTGQIERTIAFLGSQTARIAIDRVQLANGRLEADVTVENLGGHKLPTAYPARRAWLHVVVRDRNHKTVFESGALRPDGSIVGNDNDTDATRYEPHYDEIRTSDQVQIYESIMAGADGGLTTGLLTAVRYVKDNRLLPHGFDKRTANPDIAVLGEALTDANFTGAGDRVRYSVAVPSGDGPFAVEADLMYQPIGYRWANNLKKYDAAEPRRFNGYFDAMGPATAASLGHATRSQ